MPLTGALVLLVEDDSSHRTVTRAMLERLGAGVIVAANGREGLDQLEQRTPDLILCDLRMPGMDGFEFARRVRAHPRHGEARLIALTGLDPWESSVETWSTGFDAHLTKPVKLETLGALSRFLPLPRRPPGPPNLPPES
jgi:CheY-like chemotaxis protein